MQRAFVLGSFLLILGFHSCKNSQATPGKEASVQQDSLLESGKTDVIPQADTKQLGNLVGKYPKDVAMFETYLPPARMEKLLGVEYPDFVKDWGEETAIQKDGELVYFTGCRKGFCAENAYLIIVDLLNNQINIMNFKGRIVRTYEEGGVIIGLTDKLANEVQRMRSRQE
jgi:hypothetical protein